MEMIESILGIVAVIFFLLPIVIALYWIVSMMVDITEYTVKDIAKGFKGE